MCESLKGSFGFERVPLHQLMSIWKSQLNDSLKTTNNGQYWYFPLLNEHQLLQVQIKRKSNIDDTEFQKLLDKNKELLTLNSEYSIRILKLIDQVDSLTKAENQSKIKNQVLLDRIQKLELSDKELQSLVKEKNLMLQSVKDDLQLHQLELGKKDEQLNKVKEKYDSERVQYQRCKDKLEGKDFEIQELKKLLEKFESENNDLYTKLKSNKSAAELEIPNTRAFTKLALKEKFKQIHQREINCIGINSHYSLVATGSNDRKVTVHMLNSKSSISLSGASQGITSCSFSPSGVNLLASSNDNSCIIWQIDTQRQLHTFTGHTAKVQSSCYIDNTKIVSGSHDRTLRLWDVSKGYCTKTIFTLSSTNSVAAIDGNIIASGHLDNNVRLWDSSSGNLIRELSGHYSQVNCVVGDGFQLSSCARDDTIRVYDLRMFQLLHTLSSPTFRVPNNWSKHDSQQGRICCGGSDGNIYVWDGGELVQQLERHDGNVVGVVWSKDGIFSVGEKDKTMIKWEYEE